MKIVYGKLLWNYVNNLIAGWYISAVLIGNEAVYFFLANFFFILLAYNIATGLQAFDMLSGNAYIHFIYCKFGGKLGLNMANIVNTDFVDNKSKLGFHVGPTLHYGFGREGRFGIGLDVLYSQKGSTVVDKPYSLDYIDVPLYFRYRFGFGLYLETGVDLGLPMK